jgi:hypothetical protein
MPIKTSKMMPADTQAPLTQAREPMHGHPPKLRVLHIGNVANYAYNIAKVLQGKAFQSDAISWDYYHINAQPAWEEAEFNASGIGDHFFPDLPSPLESGFLLPDWYFHGPREIACLALIAQNEGKPALARMLRHLGERHMQKLSKPDFRNSQQCRLELRMIQSLGYDLVGGFGKSRIFEGSTTYLTRMSKPAIQLGAASVGMLSKKMRLLGKPVLKRRFPPLMNVARLNDAYTVLKWKLLNGLAATAWKTVGSRGALRTAWIRLARPGLPLAGRLKIWKDAPRPGRPSATAEPAPTHLEAALIQSEAVHLVEDADPTSAPAPPLLAKDAAATADSFDARVLDLLDQYRILHPDREFDPILLRQYASSMPLMQRLFKHYDIVIGYAIEGIWPLMAGKPYIAYEFGTIRNLPFEDSSAGRLAALVYHNCEKTIVTNCDNEKPAKKLGRPYFFLPHIINEPHDFSRDAGIALRRKIESDHGGDFFVFHPARQHWDMERNTNWDKGNDLFFRGFAAFVQAGASSARCIAVSWGQTLQQSKDLVASLGIESHVIWIDPLTHVSMMKLILACDIVADQFTIATFGGIPPKAFLLSKPVLTCFDPELHQWCFPEMPPLIPASNPGEVCAGLSRVYRDKAFANEIGQRGEAWYHAHNSNRRILDVLTENLKAAGVTVEQPTAR